MICSTGVSLPDDSYEDGPGRYSSPVWMRKLSTDPDLAEAPRRAPERRAGHILLATS
jgi:hypothetical protein